MLKALRAHDPQTIELLCGKGSVLIPPSLAGRIFCQLDGELVHRLDAAALQNPSPAQYDNLGGNSLWPAPEGGLFAFNYPPDKDEWMVQDGIAKAVPNVSQETGHRAVVEKRITLTNRKGVRMDLNYRRVVTVAEDMTLAKGYRLDTMGYRTEDIFEPVGEYRADDVLLAPWSLEQFPGAEGIVTFGRVAEAKDALNIDFYGDPGERISWHAGHFLFRLGGTARHQIGVKVQSKPQCIGALDLRRSMLFLRKTEIQPGVYFNIADNEQINGPYSTADLYSIFNGGELGFFELETIGAMREIDGCAGVSILPSETLILKGDQDELLRYLAEQEALHLNPSDLPAMA
ncbi:MAG: hypothetical protein IT364_21235 [Candidatus Hydrogenedentes bacterium]|nr:hypothetical protein [Candidatus Hydrogenedentota bacterium]